MAAHDPRRAAQRFARLPQVRLAGRRGARRRVAGGSGLEPARTKITPRCNGAVAAAAVVTSR